MPEPGFPSGMELLNLSTTAKVTKDENILVGET
jgi:hypothetical protein